MSQSAYYASVDESAPIGSPVITIQALGASGVAYSLPDNALTNGFFSISSTGEISVAGDLRRTGDAVLSFNVEAATSECSVTSQVSVRVIRISNPPILHLGMFSLINHDWECR